MKTIFFIYLFIFLLTAPNGICNGQNKKINIVCSTTQVADFTRQVVGDICNVYCILAPGEDPHTYQPKPVDAAIVRNADICFQNGLHLEGKNWMANLAKDAGSKVVSCTDGIAPLKIRGANKGYEFDPHAWFSPKNAAIYVNNILKAISELDPSNNDNYSARTNLYLQQLRTLDVWIRKQFNVIYPENRILVTSHDAFGYFAAEYGFKNTAPVGWSTGSELGAGMTPDRRRQVVDSLKSYGIRSVFLETSINPKLIREIAREAGIKIGGMLYSDSMGEAGTAGETYIGMMRENVLTIINGLKK